MIEDSGFNSYILLLPVIAIIGIPLIAIVVLSIAKVVFRFYDILFKIEDHDDFSEQRNTKRIDIDRLLVTVVDDFEKITGTTCNISESGICIKDLPAEKLNNSNRFPVTVNTGYQVFHIDIVRKWEEIQDNVKTIGAAIDNAPSDWLEFVASENQFA